MEWLDRLTAVMDLISESPAEGIGISELSRITGLSKGTVHRMLKSMQSHRLVVQLPQSKHYALGPKAMLWGSQFLRGQDPIGLLGQYCEKISNQTGLYSYLCRYEDGQVYCTYTHQPSHLRNKYFVHVGQRMPFHCSAASKVILAYQQEERKEEILNTISFPEYTPYTIKKPNILKDELLEIRKTRIGFCLQELEIGVSALSAAIFHDDRNTRISLSLAGETSHIDKEKDQIISLLLQVADEASEHLRSMHQLSSIQL